MGVVRQVCDRVAVMYLGELVEIAPRRRCSSIRSTPAPRPSSGPSRTRTPVIAADWWSYEGRSPIPRTRRTAAGSTPSVRGSSPPYDLDVDREAHRRVVDLRVALRDGRIDVEALRRARADGDGSPGSAASDERLRCALRAEYGIPELDDEGADEVVSAALSEVVAGRRERARVRLARTFASPCERETPAEVGGGRRRVACRLSADGRPGDAAD